MKRISVLMFILFTGLVSAAWPQAQAPGSYKFTTFDAPGAGTGNGQGTIAYGINPTGLIAGEYLDSKFVYHGFLRAPDLNGTITEFDAPDAGTGARQGTRDNYAPNAAGWITGWYIDDNGVYHGFLRTPDPNGKITEFDAPDAGTGGSQGTQGIQVNSVGEVTGYYFDAQNVTHGFLRVPDLNGTIKEGDAPDAGTGRGQGTWAFFKLRGVIAGNYRDASNVLHGFLRMPNGTFTTVDAPDAVTATYINDLNSGGATTGWYVGANGVSHGYLRTPDGTITEFDAPGAGTGTGLGTFPWSINPAGWITGWYSDAQNVRHGFLRIPNGTIKGFDVPGAGTGNGQGTFPYFINPTGWITGYYMDAKFVSHGFLLSR
jgi:hypothetical protein